MKKHDYLPETTRDLLAPHFPELDLQAIRVYFHIPWYIEYLGPIRAAAFAGSVTRIHCRPEYYAPGTPAGLALIAHELTHCLQYRRNGYFGLCARYLGAFLRNWWREGNAARAYWQIPEEIEARARAASVMAAIGSKPIIS